MNGAYPATVGLDCLIFDFDGLIVDTETPLYSSWEQVFQHYGAQPISLDEWVGSLGLHDDDPAVLDPMARLLSVTGARLQPDEVQRMRRAIRDELLAREPVLPGVEQLLDVAAGVGIPVGIASSSPVSWIERHLGPRGLLDRFATVSGAGDGLPGKPDPAVYLAACAALDADPRRSLALEDSPNGVSAAKAAGMTCFAVPNPISQGLDFSAADQVYTSLEQVRLIQH